MACSPYVLPLGGTEGFKQEVLDFQTGDEAGIKSVTIRVNGRNAYGLSAL